MSLDKLIDDEARRRVFDVHCGFAESDSDFCYDMYKASYRNGKPTLRLLSLGGSTTSWRYGRGGMWAKDLAIGISKRFKREVQLFNGGVGGYSSSQELLRLVRDGQAIEPTLVVSLSGINDVGALHQVPSFPFAHHYQKQTAEVLKTRGDIDQISLGFPNHSRKSSVWLRNQKLMGAVAGANGAAFIGFLQPTMGVGRAHLNPDESREGDDNRHRPLGEISYAEGLAQFYSEAQEALPDNGIEDLSGVFDGESGLYRDFRHQNRKGDKLISRAML